MFLMFHRQVYESYSKFLINVGEVPHWVYMLPGACVESRDIVKVTKATQSKNAVHIVTL